MVKPLMAVLLRMSKSLNVPKNYRLRYFTNSKPIRTEDYRDQLSQRAMDNIDELLTAIDQPGRVRFIAIKITFCITIGITIGAFIGKLGAMFLEKSRIFVPNENDD